MFSTGYVLHYIKEYSKKEVIDFKNIISEYIDSNSIEPNVSKGDSFDNLINHLPIGTIACLDLSTQNQKKVYICFPMFSSHISLPLKQGEIVWFYKDSVSAFDQSIQSGSPLTSINSFWLSRKIGSKLSEDLNFSHIMRDTTITDSSANKDKSIEGLPNKTVNDKKSIAKRKKVEDKKISLPDYKVTSAYKNKFSFLSEINDVFENAKLNKDVIPTAVPRWFSKPYELSLQGSNNSLINLTKSYNDDDKFKSSGAIDIVAGRHSIEKYNDIDEKEDFYVIKDKFVKNIAEPDKRKITELKINKKNSFLKIKNTVGDIELLKDQTLYFGEEFSKVNNEGILNLNSDASRIYITEFDNVDNFSFYDVGNLINFGLVNFKTSRNNIELNKDYLFKEKKMNISNFSKSNINMTKDVLPSIFIKSNNIRIVARKKRENSENILEEGSIRLIKESNDFYNSSHISMESDGKVLIDGNTVMIGNFEKELLRQNGNNSSPPDLNSMNGNGFGVLLGYNEEISEPLVLGNTLESILKEILHINIKLVEEIKTLTDDLQKHVHLGIPGSGVSGPPQLPTPYSNFSTSTQDSLKKRYLDIQNNLKEILSRFAKTS
jgi:hypothetical protein